MNLITIELCQAIPFEYMGPRTGLIQQNYDSVLFEVPEHDAERVKTLVQNCMTRSLPGLEIPFVGEAKVAPHRFLDAAGVEQKGHWGLL